MITPTDQALHHVIAGIDTALDTLEADVRRVQEALDAGISLEVYGEPMRVLREAE